MPPRKRLGLICLATSAAAACLLLPRLADSRDPIYALASEGCRRITTEHSADQSMDPSGWSGTALVDHESFLCPGSLGAVSKRLQGRFPRYRRDLQGSLYVRFTPPPSSATGPGRAHWIFAAPEREGILVTVHFWPQTVTGPAGVFWKWLGRPAWLTKEKP